MTDLDAMRPVKVEDLEVTEIDDGLVVYQGPPDRVHVLNRTAAFVFELCDGERSVNDIAEEVRGAFVLDHAPDDVVLACVSELRAKGLVR